LNRLKHFLLFIFLTCCFAAESKEMITLQGYLGKNKLEEVKKQLNETEKVIIIELDSSSGDLQEVLAFAAALYRQKIQQKKQIVVYIKENAIGPAAIIPFLANDLYISYYVSWGDIPLGTDEVLPSNILKSRVTSLIDSKDENVEQLRLIAAAMVDPNLLVISDKGLKIISSEKGTGADVVAPIGQTLVLNQNQMVEYNLVKAKTTLKEFRSYYELTIEEQEALKEAAAKKDSPAISSKVLVEELTKAIHFNREGSNTIGHIKIDDRSSGINQATWLYVKKAFEFYKNERPIFVILELNTPGGEVFAAQKISDALKELDAQLDIPVVAFIDNWAISAGAMLAYSCRFITAANDASMGAAEPVLMGEGGKMESASEKINSALRTDFANRARFFDRNPDIAEAMVDKDIILVLRHGQVVRLDNPDQIRSKGINPDIVITNKGKLLTLNAQKMLDLGVADLIVKPGKIEDVTASEEGQGEWSFSKEALSKAPFFNEIPDAVVKSYRMDWKTQFFVLLATPFVSSLLMLGLMLGFYIEFNTPGFGLPGALGVFCLVLIVISSMSLEIANWLELVFLLAGVTLIVAELFLIPTGGILGLIGAVFAIGGLFAMMLPGVGSIDFEFDTRSFNAAGDLFFERLAWFCGTLVLAFILIAFLSRYVTPNLAGFNRFVLTGHEQNREQGYIAGDDPKALPPVGSQGVVLATLRPAGKVEINQVIYDAVTRGGFIEKGEAIVVGNLDGSVIVVEKVEEGK